MKNWPVAAEEWDMCHITFPAPRLREKNEPIKLFYVSIKISTNQLLRVGSWTYCINLVPRFSLLPVGNEVFVCIGHSPGHITPWSLFCEAISRKASGTRVVLKQFHYVKVGKKCVICNSTINLKCNKKGVKLPILSLHRASAFWLDVTEIDIIVYLAQIKSIKILVLIIVFLGFKFYTEH